VFTADFVELRGALLTGRQVPQGGGDGLHVFKCCGQQLALGLKSAVAAFVVDELLDLCGQVGQCDTAPNAATCSAVLMPRTPNRLDSGSRTLLR
jgi:hypothetical protein